MAKKITELNTKTTPDTADILTGVDLTIESTSEQNYQTTVGGLVTKLNSDFVKLPTLNVLGDLLYYNGTEYITLEIGTNGRILQSDGTKPVWANVGVGDMKKTMYDPSEIEEQLVGLTATQTLSNKTLTSPAIINFVNATHTHTDPTEGGTIQAAAISDFDTEVNNNANVVANTAKVTNATHTGEVTGNEALTIADNVIDEANLKLDTAPTNDYVLTADSAASGGMKWSAASAGGVTSVNGEVGVVILNTNDIPVDTDANYVTDAEKVVIGNTSGTNTGDMSNADVKTAYEANADTNAFTDAEKTLLGNQSNTNTGDQTSIVGISGTTAQFNTALSDGSFATGGGTATGTNTGDQIISDATITTADITTNNATNAKHGFLPKLNDITTNFLRGDGTWAIPTGGGSFAWGESVSGDTGDGLTLAKTGGSDYNLSLSTNYNGSPNIELLQNYSGDSNTFAFIDFRRMLVDTNVRTIAQLQPYTFSKTSASDYQGGMAFSFGNNGITTSKASLDYRGVLTLGSYAHSASNGGTNGIDFNSGTAKTTISSYTGYIYNDSGTITIQGGNNDTQLAIDIPDSTGHSTKGQRISIGDTQTNKITGIDIDTGASAQDHTSLYLTGTRHSMYIGDTVAPTIATNRLYSLSGDLTWGGGFSADDLQIAGTDINTGGTLTNVAYLDQANTFTSTGNTSFAGNVGIGTSTPVSNLEIADSNITNGAILSLTNTAEGGWTAGDKIGTIDFRITDASASEKNVGSIKLLTTTTGNFPSKTQMAFSTAYSNVLSEAMRIDHNGNVGIGTSTPESKAHIKMADAGITAVPTPSVALTLENSTSIYEQFITPSGTFKGIFFNEGEDLDGSQIRHYYNGTPADTRYEFRGNASEWMRLQNGNLGIGTSTPTTKLEVSSANIDVLKLVRDSAPGSGASLLFENSDAEQARIWLNGGQSLLFDVGNTIVTDTKMILTSSGNLGLGKVNPTHKLHINTESPETTSVMIDGEANQEKVLKIRNYQSSDAAGDNSFGYISAKTANAFTLGARYSNVNTDVLTWNKDGEVGIGTTTPYGKLAIVEPDAMTSASAGEPTLFIPRYDNPTLAVPALEIRQADATTALGANGTIIHAQNRPIAFSTANNDSNHIIDRIDLTITNAGKVGIGTPTPTSKFQIGDGTNAVEELQILTSNAGIQQIRFGDTDDTDIGTIRYEHATNFMSFGVAASERMRITSAGNVGIGTTAPTSPLSVSGIIQSEWDSYGTGYGGLFLKDDNGTSLKSAFIQYGAGHASADNLTIKNYSTIGNIGLFTNSLERLTVGADGKVGIGTTTPNNLLSIKKTGAGFSFDVDRTDGKFMKMSVGSTDMNLIYDDSGKLNIAMQNRTNIASTGVLTDVMTFDTAGNVGIGTISPDEQLEMTGRLHLGQTTAPAITTDKLYNVGGTLTWGGYVQSKLSNVWAYVSASAVTTVTTAGTYYPIQGTFVNDMTDFGAATTNTPGIKYTGTLTRNFKILIQGQVESDSTNTTATIGVKKNGTLITGSDISTICRVADSPYHIGAVVMVELAQNDEIQLVTTSDGSGDELTYPKLQTLIEQVK